MDDLKSQMKDHFIKYASYVILDRAIPSVVDGLKPVQRRILQTLYAQGDEKLHKVANIVGQSMQLHPHGDAPIYEALVTLANKGFMLDRQGNFGNIFTGDPSAAARYIETRLSSLARETLFNPDITDFIPSYDGRNKEPVVLPAKIPLLLMQGVDGIAVGMSTHILPHNFVELLQAQIAILEGRPFKIFPDFPTGGVMDKSLYDAGKGKVKLRAKIEIRDSKTLVITEICYGTTTESLIRSIDEAAKKGKIKIEAINDYTAKNVEIEIKLPRGQYAEEILDALYGFTECEVALNSQIIVIKDDHPWETDVHSILEFNTQKLVSYHTMELQIEKERLLEKIFYKTLERIFIENRIYKKIETIKTLEGIHESLDDAFKPYAKKLLRLPTSDDRERLLQIPIRRISQFDIDRNQEEIELFEASLKKVEKNLKNVKGYSIAYIKALLDKYGSLFARKTKVKAIEEIDRRAIETKEIKVFFDISTGFVGTKVASQASFTCTNFDKIQVFMKDGTYKVTAIADKQYFEGLLWASVADKKTAVFVLFTRKDSTKTWAKRFIVDKFIMDKSYPFLDEGCQLLHITTGVNEVLEITFAAKGKDKTTKMTLATSEVQIKGAQTRGVCISPLKIKKFIIAKSS
jgi:topoisomerase-4 subunit A